MSFHFLLGGFLPKSDFMLVAKLPNLYQEYEKINGKTNFFEFLEEQFLEQFLEQSLNFESIFGLDDDDENEENEAIPIPFQSQQLTNIVLFSMKNIQFSFNNFAQILEKNFLIYKESYFYIFSGFVFQPPKN